MAEPNETTRLDAPGWYRPHAARVDHYFVAAPEHAGGGFIALCEGWAFDAGREIYNPRPQSLYSQCKKCLSLQRGLAVTPTVEVH